MLRLSDLLEVLGVLLLLVAAVLWDLRAALALVGLVAVVAGYVLGDGEVIE